MAVSRAVLRGLQALLIFCLGFSLLPDVLRTAHTLAVHHVACPYDGALVHEEELAPEARAALERDRSQPQHGPALSPRHQHENCCGKVSLHRPSALVPAHPGARAATLVEVVRVASGAERAIARAVLSYAPKLPPPARA
jgi:hypothetical protein